MVWGAGRSYILSYRFHIQSTDSGEKSRLFATSSALIRLNWPRGRLEAEMIEERFIK